MSEVTRNGYVLFESAPPIIVQVRDQVATLTVHSMHSESGRRIRSY